MRMWRTASASASSGSSHLPSGAAITKRKISAMRFLILGSGGVGGYFGGKLAYAGLDVTFIARGAHLEALRRTGLVIKSPDGVIRIPHPQATDHPESIAPVDVVLHCVKTYDLDEITRRTIPVLTDQSVIISLQNGIGIEERIHAILPRGVVYGGVAYVYSTATAPGEITESGGPRKIVFGPMDNRRSVQAENIHRAFHEAGISAEIPASIQTELWKKFIFISAVGGITALTRLTLGEILAVDDTRTLLADAMREPELTGRMSGIQLPADMVDSFFETLKRFRNETRSSLYYDLTHGRPLEIESLSGTVVRLGAQHHVATPIHRTIYAALLPYHQRALRLRSRP